MQGENAKSFISLNKYAILIIMYLVIYNRVQGFSVCVTKSNLNTLQHGAMSGLWAKSGLPAKKALGIGLYSVVQALEA